jgi:AcrR family transcriptional regulator
MGIEERKHRDRERRIREILSAARELFLHKGLI